MSSVVVYHTNDLNQDTNLLQEELQKVNNFTTQPPSPSFFFLDLSRFPKRVGSEQGSHFVVVLKWGAHKKKNQKRHITTAV